MGHDSFKKIILFSISLCILNECTAHVIIDLFCNSSPCWPRFIEPFCGHLSPERVTNTSLELSL